MFVYFVELKTFAGLKQLYAQLSLVLKAKRCPYEGSKKCPAGVQEGRIAIFTEKIWLKSQFS